MIIREALDEDLRPLAAFARKVLGQQNVLDRFDPTADRFRRARDTGHRIVVLFDREKLVAALSAYPCELDGEKAMQMKAFLIDLDRPDRLDLADRLALWSMMVVAREGYTAILSRRSKDIPGTVYGRDVLRMRTLDGGADHVMTAPISAMIDRIYERHPDWRTSL